MTISVSCYPEFLDGTISSDQESAVAQHLAPCEACTAELRELKGVTELYHEHGTLQLPDAARTRIAEALRIVE